MKKQLWNGFDLCEDSINIVINALKNNKDNFKIVTKRKNIYLHKEKRLIYRHIHNSCLKDHENFNDYLPLVSGIRRDIDKYIDNHKNVAEFPVNNNCVIQNINNYKNLKNDSIFHEIDIKEAYFQVMHILGYITDKLYNKYSHFDQYKKGYIYGITWLQSDEIVSIYKKGKLVKEYNKFRPQYKVMFDNIRYFINDITDEAVKCCTPTGFLKKRVDAVYCDIESSEKICEFYKDHGIEVKITHLVKKDNTFCLKNGKGIRF